MKALLCDLLFSCVLAAGGPRTADELAYGTLLYAYFQDDHAGALVEALVAEQRGALGSDPTRFVLAKGSLAFSLGMNRLSDASLASIDAAALTDVDRMRLAFHHARADYRDGAIDAMAAHLADIRFESGWFGQERQHPEVAFLRAEAAIAAGDLAAAERHLAGLARDADELGYGLFNLAVAYRAAGRTADAHATLGRLARLRLESPAGRDLMERGRLAWAITAAEIGEVVDAQTVLERLPAASFYRHKALAAYGDLAMQRGDPALAARVWLTLRDADDWHSDSATAALGLPQALEALDAPDRALDAWHTAAASLEARLERLAAVRASTDQPSWPRSWLAVRRAEQPLPSQAVPPGIAETFGATAWIEWLARNDVNHLIGEWRELQRMQLWLDALPDRLAALEEVKQERRRRAGAARERLAGESLASRRQALAERVSELDEAIERLADPARKLDDSLIAALATPAEQRRLARLARLESAFAAAPPTQRDPLTARAQRLRGVVLWEIAETRSERVRALARERAAARALLADVDARIARVDRAEAEFATGVEADFGQLADRSSELARDVAMQLADREAAIAEAFRRTVDEEQAHVEQHLLSARIAIARATDQLAAGPAAREPGT